MNYWFNSFEAFFFHKLEELKVKVKKRRTKKFFPRLQTFKLLQVLFLKKVKKTRAKKSLSFVVYNELREMKLDFWSVNYSISFNFDKTKFLLQ